LNDNYIKQKHYMVRLILYTILVSVTFKDFIIASDWPQWRGVEGQGHSIDENLPVEWSEEKNIAWKISTSGRGWSSPVILNDQIWFTSAEEILASEEEAKKRLKENTGSQPLTLLKSSRFFAICIDKKSGKIIHDIELFTVNEPQWVHRFNSYASPTPIIEKGRIYCHFGTYGTACVDTKSGEVLWRNLELKCMHENGPASCPVIYGDSIIFHMDGSDVQFVAALKKDNGSLKWKTSRSGKMHDNPQLKKGYSTPIIINRNGEDELISPGANWLYSYDPKNGKENWKVDYEVLGFSNVARPVSGDGMIYLATCFMRSQMLGVSVGVDPKIVWRYRKGVPNTPSPLFSNGLLYFVGDSGGLVTCLDAKSGELVWSERIASGKYWASPFIANGKIYFHNEDGVTTVIEDGRNFKLVSKNKVDGKLMSSAAVSEGAIFMRSDTALYKIENK
jgi:hypothetical protein